MNQHFRSSAQTDKASIARAFVSRAHIAKQ